MLVSPTSQITRDNEDNKEQIFTLMYQEMKAKRLSHRVACLLVMFTRKT